MKYAPVHKTIVRGKRLHETTEERSINCDDQMTTTDLENLLGFVRLRNRFQAKFFELYDLD